MAHINISIAPGISVPIPYRDIPEALALQADERLMVKKLLNTPAIDGGKEIRISLNYEKEKS